MLSEEEKKAIEYYSDKEVSFSVDFDTEKLLKSLGITEEDSFENHQIRIKTLLNLITKLQKEKTQEKESWEKYCNELNEEIIEKNNKIFDLEMQVEKLEKENKEKDKQIDIMADFMYKTGTGRRALSCMFRQNDECSENGCNYCIKQYFADLVEKE